jgi:anaerobic selenocysteine-containing dehydrogenase
MTKLHQYSNLRLGRSRAALHPETARSCGSAEGGRAVLETSLGRCEILVVVDSSVPPGVVQVAAAPEAIDICGAFARCRVAFL